MLNLPLSTGGGTVPDPYTPDDGTWNVTGGITATGTISAATLAATGLTAGSIVYIGASGVLSEDASRLFWDSTAYELGVGTSSPAATLDVVSPAGAATAKTSLRVAPGAYTGATASTEFSDLDVIDHTGTWATGALTTQRFIRYRQPTIAFAGASTVTTAVTFAVDAAPAAGSFATFTNVFAARIGGDVSAGATTASFIYRAVDVPAHTLTVTGSTGVTSVGPAALGLGILTVTDASAVTVDTAATLYIAGAPAQAGSVTITNTYAVWVDAGNVRVDGKIVGLTQATASGDAVHAGRTLTASTGLSGGGDLTADRSFSLANTAVVAGTYTRTTLTVDAQGRLTSASSGSSDLAIGGAVTSGTSGSVLFVDSSGNLAQDNTNLNFNDATNTLTTGAITAASDTDATFTFGRARVYNPATDQAGFAHIDRATATGYALLQTTAGLTILGAAATQNISFAKDGTAVWTIDASTHYLSPAADASYDIGTSLLRPRDLRLSRDAYIGNTLDVVGAITCANLIADTAGIRIPSGQVISLAGAPATATLYASGANDDVYVASTAGAVYLRPSGVNAVAARSTGVTFSSGVTLTMSGLIDLSGISAGSMSMKFTATSDTPTVTWNTNNTILVSAAPAGYIEIGIGGASRYIPFWA